MNENKLCFKCGISSGEKQKNRDGKTVKATILTHHTSYNPEVLVSCCKSCHGKIHTRIRKQNKCPLSVKETQRLSANSCHRRTNKNIVFYEQMIPCVRLWEMIKYNINTGNFGYSSGFGASKGKNIWNEEI